MEMMVTQSVGGAPQAQQSGTSGASKGSAAGGFQQALIQQMNSGENTHSTIAAQPVLVAVIGVSGEVAAASGEVSEMTLNDLMAVIDGLIDQLAAPHDAEQQSEAKVIEEQLAQLEAGLEQVAALLALLGIHATLIQNKQAADVVAEEKLISVTEQAVTLRSQLQDNLLQLQALLQQGNLKRSHQQDPLVLVSKQLEALTAILSGSQVQEESKAAKAEGSHQQLFVAQLASVQKEAESMLQRLNSQAIHSVAWSGKANLETSMAGQDAIQPMVNEVTTINVGAQSLDSQRAFTQLVANAAPAPTTYVAADEFAKSMSGMIVQKFDLTTLNGVSEAKLMLFPEHLGQVDVKITMQNGLLTAVFQTDTAMAKDLLDNQMAQLRLALQSQGLNVDKLEVSQGQSASQLAGQQQGQSGGQQQSSRQASNGDRGAVDTSFESEIVEQAAVQGLGYGRAINVKA